MAAPLLGIRACVFDAYGTLFDFTGAAASCRNVLGERAGPLTTLWRERQLQYTWLRGLQGRYADFWQVTSDSLDFALEALVIDEPGLRDRLLALYRTLAPFPEVADVLRQLKRAGFATATRCRRRGVGDHAQIAPIGLHMVFAWRAHKVTQWTRPAAPNTAAPRKAPKIIVHLGVLAMGPGARRALNAGRQGPAQRVLRHARWHDIRRIPEPIRNAACFRLSTGYRQHQPTTQKEANHA